MKVVIDNVTYSKIKNPNFGTQTDVTAQEMPINEFSVDIVTNDNIALGQYAYLYNDDNVLWAKYWIVDAIRYSDIAITIHCQSDLLRLSRKKLMPRMFISEYAGSLIRSIFTTNGLDVDIDTALNSVEINGYAPEQTARERLQWLCFVSGAYIQTDFTDRTKVILSDNAAERLALNDIVYYRPTLEASDIITGIRITLYSYFEGTPATTDEWVKADGVVYIQSSWQEEILNPEATATTPENFVEINDVSLVNQQNHASILNRLSRAYFKRFNVNADIINNGEYKAGQKITLDVGTGEIVTGVISSTNFSFGHNHKSSLTISQADISQGVKLNIKAEYNSTEIAKSVYYLPAGYMYNIQNKYIDKYGFVQVSGETAYAKTVYRPQNINASGTVGNAETTNIQEYDIALQQKYKNVSVYIVESASESSGKVVFG